MGLNVWNKLKHGLIKKTSVEQGTALKERKLAADSPDWMWDLKMMDNTVCSFSASLLVYLLFMIM